MLATTDHYRFRSPASCRSAYRAVWLTFGFFIFFSGQTTPDAISATAQSPDGEQLNHVAIPITDDPAVIVTPAQTDQIEQLISQLDAGDFSDRENAILKLAALGERAIGPLALKSLECSPETCWRIRKTLEEICVTSDESVLYKSAGILQLRFHRHDKSISARLLKLEAQWRQHRQDQAINRMRKLGAQVEDPWEGIEQQRFAANLNFLQGVPVAPVDVFNRQPSPTQAPPEQQPDKTITTRADQVSQINKVLESSLDENRQFVFGANRPAATPTQLDASPRIWIDQAGILRQVGNNRIGVIFPSDWKGTSADLKSLHDIEKIGHVGFENQTVSLESLKIIASLETLGRLSINNCKISSKDLGQLDWSKSMQEVAFIKQPITTDLIDGCRRVPSLLAISFDRCEVVDKALDSLRKIKTLRELEFKETEIQKSTFDVLAKLRLLNSITFSACKFQTVDYRELKRRNPSLQIAFTAQALLGIRSNQADLFGVPAEGSTPRTGCEVSEIINPSGAHSAGMVIGDIIEKIDGQDVKSFEDLKLHIAQHLAGDELDVQIRRGEEIKNLKVKLGKMDTTVIR